MPVNFGPKNTKGWHLKNPDSEGDGVVVLCHENGCWLIAEAKATKSGARTKRRGGRVALCPATAAQLGALIQGVQSGVIALWPVADKARTEGAGR